MKRVLLLNASHNDEALLRSLKKLGCYIITTGNRADLPGHKMADEYVCADYTDKEKMLSLAREKRVDAVCPCGNDFGVKVAAYVSEKLGFKGSDSYETTLILHDKDLFKAFVAKHQDKINSPVAIAFDNEMSAKRWAANNSKYPLIVKAVDLSAGNGIKKATNAAELIADVENAFSYSREKRILIEPFIEGSLHGFCTFLVNKKVVAYRSDNEYCLVNPYRVDLITMPSLNENVVRDDLIGQIEYMAKELNLVDGIFHLQYIFDGHKAHIIECMRRVLGNMDGVSSKMHNDGFDWDYWEARAKCGFGCEGFPIDPPHVGVWGHKALVAHKNGKYVDVEIPEDIKSKVYFEYTIHEKGYNITNYKSDPVGLIFMKFSSVEERDLMLVKRYDEIKVIVE